VRRARPLQTAQRGEHDRPQAWAGQTAHASIASLLSASAASPSTISFRYSRLYAFLALLARPRRAESPPPQKNRGGGLLFFGFFRGGGGLAGTAQWPRRIDSLFASSLLLPATGNGTPWWSSTGPERQRDLAAALVEDQVDDAVAVTLTWCGLPSRAHHPVALARLIFFGGSNLFWFASRAGRWASELRGQLVGASANCSTTLLAVDQRNRTPSDMPSGAPG